MTKAIRLLALDLDDTLLRSDLTISYRTRGAVKRADAAGARVVLASGRIPAAMDRFARLLGLNKRPGFLICNNGTMIQESNTGGIIFDRRIDTRPALAAFDLAAAEGFPVQLYEDDIMYVSRPNEYADYDQKLTGLRQVIAPNFRDMIAQGCHKLLIPGDPVLLAPLETILRSYLGDEITLFTSKPYYLEVLPRDCNKGAALAWIAGTLGIDASEVMAVGDSMNDEAMIRWAGLGVAMANGDERLKQIAAAVTPRSNDEDGVADVIEQFILKPAG